MMRDWKPGDVALICVSDYPPEVAVHDGNAKWYVAGPRLGSQHGWYEDRVEVIRPLVVIDPEDREQVERLTGLYLDAPGSATDVMQAALREFANPTPPKPPEPQGLGAVVEDDEGETWLRDWKGYWRRPDMTVRWSAIAAVRVLSEGVTP